jgi:integrase
MIWTRNYWTASPKRPRPPSDRACSSRHPNGTKHRVFRQVRRAVTPVNTDVDEAMKNVIVSRLRYNTTPEAFDTKASGAGSAHTGTVTGQHLADVAHNTTVPMPRCGAADVLGYVPAELHKGKVWYIDFYAMHPISGILKRKRIKVNRVKAPAARRAYARQLIAELNRRLQAGWTPWSSGDGNAASFISLEDAMVQWQRVKSRTLRHSSPYSYDSILRILRQWCREQDLLSKHVAHFSSGHASSYMYHLTDVRGISARTYNNYLTFSKMLFGYFVERRMCTTNPFEAVSKQRPSPKSRTYLTEQDRQEMVEWMRVNDPDLLLPVSLIYGALIRPGELRRLRVGNVDLDRQVISLPPEVTKTGVERTPAIPDWLMPYLLLSGLHKMPSKAWLIGRNLIPGENPVARNTLRNRWVKMRTELRWPSSKQLYSLRDTGIIQLLRDGVDLLHVMQQAGHTEIGTTNQYLRHAFPNGPAEVKNKATSLYESSGLIVARNGI